MPKYGITTRTFTTATATTSTTALGVFPNATGEQAEIVELIMTGAGATAAADTMHIARATHCTFGATGISTSLTPEPFSDGSVAALSSCGAAYTSEPTAYSGQDHLAFGFNQRGGMRWAVPQGEGMRLNNAFTDKGLGWRVNSAAAGSIDATVHFWE
jgi:hypothetical protein